MQSLHLIADFTLPGNTGARTKDITAIQKNILVIQQAFREKIYKPGDIGNTRVLVITGVCNYVCVISLQLLELTGYMSFINCEANEQAALGIFRAICPVRDSDAEEIEMRFAETYRKVKKGLVDVHDTVLFVGKHAVQNAEMAY